MYDYDDEVTLCNFHVYYYNEAGNLDYAILRAEDEDHARYLFENYYPGEKIESIEDNGSAF